MIVFVLISMIDDCYLSDLPLSWLFLQLTLSIILQTAEGSGLTLNSIFI